MLFEPCAQRLRFFAFGSGQIGVDVGRWRRRWRPHEFVQHPGAAQHRRRAVAVGSPEQDRALAEQTPSLGILQFHAPELRTENVGDAVMPRQPFVQERVVRRQQFVHASILKQNARNERFDLDGDVLAQRIIE